MSLTSTALLILAVCSAVAAPAATYVLWNRARGPRPVRAAARLGLIGLCQATMLLLVGLLVNNHYSLYASWSDLLGQDGGGPVAVRQATDAATDLNHPVTSSTDSRGRFGFGGHGQGSHSTPPSTPRTGNAGNTAKPAWVSGNHGTLIAAFRGPHSGIGGNSGDVHVWLPPQYHDPAYANTRFPVVMLFPGYPGSPTGWFSVLNGGQILGQMAARQQATPFVLVAVNVNQHGENLNCSNIPGGPQMATYVAEDVRTMIEANFRVSDQRTGWGLMGFSDGGLCAGKLLMQYPQYFRSAAQLAGDSTPDGDQVVRAGAAFVERNSTLWLLKHHHPSANQPVSLLASVSDQDTDSLPVAFQLQAAAPDIVSVSEHAHGAHNPAVWRSWLPEMYTWLSRHLDKASG
ncbi:putative esterase [Catenulispora acidiphila DSM 44928]|uniref:Putative esterase n=1 Tax=Catenulispora acidiphila (strain DSM 44928 / JCM 14897 / NBRC 102108 / NRRL B-24433 / ID139908) TaxID=479433 RepID=C7Q7S8_CATAD|nr:esterase [Catenulispora acidiphila]ACU72271.1 putative esterase [Catenulispora acidiphila DSM 44928]